MADTLNNKPKMQLRTALPTVNGDKSPSPATKLLINHGKPNFTIQRSPKADENANGNPLSPQATINNNYSAFKSANSVQTKNNINNNNNNNINNNNNKDVVIGTKFNGVFKPSNVQISAQQTDAENEAAKVVLRRAKMPDLPIKDGEDENVPEFIRRQRRIQERLAKENILDFENRRSGYFTHVMISPDSPNRTSFVETMSSPAIVPSLEIPPPPATIQEEKASEMEVHATPAVAVSSREEVSEEQQKEAAAHEVPVEETAPLSNGHAVVHDDVEADVAQAIEEVNKAVAGEDDDKEPAEVIPVIAVTSAPLETPAAEPLVAEVLSTSVEECENSESNAEAAAPVVAIVTSATIESSQQLTNDEQPKENGHIEEIQQNGHSQTNGTNGNDVTISHTNGSSEGPSIPSPDPSGALGVNYEPKTVVSFAQELSNGENKYPDTVKIVTDALTTPADDDLQELSKLKFDIKSDAQDVQVTSVLRAE